MKTVIKVLRLTAKLLLIAAPLMILSGLLTAKPFLISGLDFSTARLLHTKVMAAIFIGLLFVHSLMGIRLLLGRSKKLDTGAYRIGFMSAWAVLFLALASLYFIKPPEVTLPPDDLPRAEADADPEAGAAPDAAAAGAADSAAGDATPDGAPEPAADRDAAPDGEARADAEAGPSKAGPAEAGASDDRGPTKGRAPRAPAKTKRPDRDRGRATGRDGPSEPDPEPPDTASPSETQRPPEEPRGSGDAEPARLSGSQLVRQRCNTCHGLDQVFGVRHTPAEWRTIVVRMVAIGAQLTDQERQAVIRYLAATRGPE